MTSLESIISKCRHQIPECHIQQVFDLHSQLADGVSFHRLGGTRIKQSPHIIRFKIGRNWRLLYCEKGRRLEAYCFITRQCFDRTVKRR